MDLFDLIFVFILFHINHLNRSNNILIAKKILCCLQMCTQIREKGLEKNTYNIREKEKAFRQVDEKWRIDEEKCGSLGIPQDWRTYLDSR